MPEETFEMKFGQLAENQLVESVPALIPYKIGFQVIDKNDEDTRAIGVLGFIINDIWAYMPVFFLEGKLKGMNTLYLKNEDMFVPARDNWISVIKDKGKKVLGSVAEGKDEEKHETMDEAYAPESIDITENEYSQFKYASANDIMDIDSIAKMRNNPQFKVNLDLFDNIEKLDKAASSAFDEAMKDADFANNMLQFYEEKTLDYMTRPALPKTASSTVDGKNTENVKIIKSIDDPAAKTLKSAEKSALMKNGIYVIDNRDEKSKVYHGETQFTLTNPSEDGVYDILLADGTLKPMGVIMLSTIGCPSIYKDHSPSRAGSDINQSNYLSNVVGKPVVLFDVNKPECYYRTTTANLYGRENKTATLKDSLSKAKKATRTNLIQLKGSDKEEGHGGAFTFIVPGITKAFEIKLDEDLVNGTIKPNMVKKVNNYDDAHAQITFTDKPGKLTKYGDTLFIPTEAVVLRKCTRKEEKEGPHLGDANIAYGSLMKSASRNLKAIDIFASGNTAELIYEGKSSGLQKRADALVSLIIDHGIDAGQAQQMLNAAKSSKHSKADFLIKHASISGPAYTAEEKSSISTIEDPAPQRTEERKRGKEINPQEVINSANEAAKSGIQEVFSVNVIKSLASIADISEVNKDYVKEMLQTLDKLGRMLFIYYWYSDEMENKFGEDDMDKLEDTLNQVFLNLGDLVLFLKEKSIYTSGVSDNIQDTLSEDIGASGDL